MITDPAQAVGLEGTVRCTVALDEITTVSIHNDVGGTAWLPPGAYRVRVTRAWDDYETGWRAEGLLLEEEVIAASRQAGATAYGPKLPLTPLVWFGLDDFDPDDKAGA